MTITSPIRLLMLLQILSCAFIVSSAGGQIGPAFISGVEDVRRADGDRYRNDIERGQEIQRKWGALWNLDFMIGCTTGRGFVEAIYDYAWYGCYCGLGGRGVPVDDTDRCCMMHDNCYDVASKSICRPQPDEYVISYTGHYRMTDCQTSNARITCDSVDRYPWWYPMKRCAIAMCECDAAIAECLARSTLRPQYIFYRKLTCRTGVAPTIAPALTSPPQTPPQSTFKFPTDIPTELFDTPPDTTTFINEGRNDQIDDVVHDVIGNEDNDVIRKYSRERFLAKLAEYKRRHFPNYFKTHDTPIKK